MRNVAAVGLAVAIGLAPAGADAQRDRAIPPGQEALAGEILGAGVELPAGCRFEGAALQRHHVDARYRCGGEVVRLILRRAGATSPAGSVAGCCPGATTRVRP